MWIQYGGQYSAAGTHGSCPERYRNRAYINNDLWDIHAMGDCVAGSYCAGTIVIRFSIRSLSVSLTLKFSLLQ